MTASLPDGNGLDFCGQYQHIPFICMSASDCGDLAIANGAAAFLEKPFNLGDLLVIIKDVQRDF